MSEPTMRSVMSSSVARIGYDAESGELWVVWQNGRTSVYEGVPPDVADTCCNAWSIGKTLNDLVKNQYSHQYA